MHVALLIADNPACELPPLEVGYLSAFLKKHCWWVETSLHRSAETLAAAQPGLLVTVGPSGSLPDRADIGVAGDGDRALLEAVRLHNDHANPAAGDLVKIAGLRWRRDGRVVVNPGTGAVEDVNELPFADRELIGDASHGGTVHLATGRGERAFSAERIAGEIAEVRRRFHPRVICFADDRLVGDPDRWAEFAAVLRQRKLHAGVAFRTPARPERITKRLAKELAELNFRAIDFVPAPPEVVARARMRLLAARAQTGEAEAARLRRDLDTLRGSRLVQLAIRLRRR